MRGVTKSSRRSIHGEGGAGIFGDREHEGGRVTNGKAEKLKG